MKEGWEIKKLKDVCSYDKEIVTNPDLPYVGLEHIESKSGKFVGTLKPTTVKSSTFHFTEKHVLYGRLRPYLNKVFLPFFEGHCSTEIFPISVTTRILREYLYYWFLLDSTVKKIDATRTGARMPRANMTQVSEFEIPLPPLSEQKEIVALLDDVLSRIDKARENIEKNVKYAEKLFLSKSNKVFTEILETYGSVKLESITELITKGSSPKWQGVNYTKEPGILFVTSENVSKGHMDFSVKKYVESRFSDIERKSVLKKGDVLTNIVGASIGRTAIYTGNEIANINQAICLIRCNSIKISNTYLMYLLNSPYFIQVLHDNEIDNARANLSLSFFRNLTIPCPSLEVQQDTVAELDALEKQRSALTNLYTQKLQALDELRNSLLEKAFRGELT